MSKNSTEKQHFDKETTMSIQKLVFEQKKFHFNGLCKFTCTLAANIEHMLSKLKQERSVY